MNLIIDLMIINKIIRIIKMIDKKTITDTIMEKENNLMMSNTMKENKNKEDNE